MINLKTLLGLPSFLNSTDNLLSLDMNFSVDNREVNEDSIFIAIVGEKYNPLEHLNKVFGAGCRFVVYEKNQANDKLVEPFLKKLVFIATTDIFAFIQEAGFAVANSFKTRGGKIIAISGSNGKTTTKEMLTHILQNATNEENVISTQKNNNNHLGVPFTLFQIRKETSLAVVELGSNHPGEIEHLCKMIRPQYGVTTNIGDTHLEFFGTRENVFKEEASLACYATEKFLINNDDELLKTLEDVNNTIRYGEKANIVFDLENSTLNTFKVENSNILGRHNKVNLMVALSLASEVLKIPVEKLIKYAESFKPTANRSQWLEENGQKIFLDAYNANPSSMMTSLNSFLEHMATIGAKPAEVCLIVGDMNELGDNEIGYHKTFGQSVDPALVDCVIFVGRFANAFTDGFKGKCKTYASALDQAEEIWGAAKNAKYIFIKGSRSLQLETILDIR